MMVKKKVSEETNKSQKAKDKTKGKKTYSLATAEVEGQEKSDVSQIKVVLPAGLESEILTFIQDEHKKKTKDYGELSKRLTNKKLSDMYDCLSGVGFEHKQIETAMLNTVKYGGDIRDALDWLCLNTQNDKLPDGFSETLQKYEEKQKEKFDQNLQEDRITKFTVTETQKSCEPQVEKVQEKKPAEPSLKNWILQYACESSDEDDVQPAAPVDPNEKYLELQEQLWDARQEAAQAKRDGDKTLQREVSKKISDLNIEMKALESAKGFNPSVKTMRTPPARTETSTADQGRSPKASEITEKNTTEPESFGFNLFDEAAKPTTSAASKVEPVKKQDVRSFEYTRQQWTGKSPKQFLIDWCRKNLPKCDPPKYEKIHLPGSKFKCKVKIDRKKDGGLLEVCPEILCENTKEAEHLGCTLALYHLCKGQSVYQLLPPPYREVWLDWIDEEKKANNSAKENKVRDEFLSKFMKKLKLESKNKLQVQENEPVDSWEDIKSSEEETSEEEENLIQENNRPKDSPSKKSHRHVTLSPDEMKNLLTSRMEQQNYLSLLKTRQELPVYQYKANIVEQLMREPVVVIAGETGSGKSTQVPQFILEEFILRGEANMCNIVCTEPRRISAISLANRVSQELGENRPGSKNSFCGYQIRFESKKSLNTRLLYCTTGVLLRQLQSDSKLTDVTHIIVDEVHERSVQSDFLLIILKHLLTRRADLHVILMSATVDSAKFSRYFNNCPVIQIPGRTFPVEVFHLEDIVERTHYSLEEDSPYTLRADQLVDEENTTIEVTGRGGESQKTDLFWTKENISTIDRTNLNPDEYSLRTRNTITRLQERKINMELIIDLLKYLNDSPEFHSQDGAVLIFLPGLAHIQELYDLINSDGHFTCKSGYKVIALHSILSSSDQSEAFDIAPPGVRKIVLATNIAETGVTIPDVVFVIDTGKAKENRYIESSQMSSLEEVFISKASCKQRQGRAGRVRAGYCFRLYTKERFTGFKDYSLPEIMRTPLEELCLHIMKCEMGNPVDFLSQAIHPPQPQVVDRAMKLLIDIGACDEEGENLTALGQHLACLPVHVRIGKMLIFSAILGCLEPVAVIAAAMTDKSPFVAPIGKQDLSHSAKLSLSVGASDQLTIYKAFLGWKAAKQNGYAADVAYCNNYFLRRTTLLEIQNVSSDLINLVNSIGFSVKDHPSLQALAKYKPMKAMSSGVVQIKGMTEVGNLDPNLVLLIKAVLAAGLYPHVGLCSYSAPVDAAVNPQKKTVCVAETSQGACYIHPGSVNRWLEANGWIVYHEKVKSSRVYLRDCTLISPYPLLLFGGLINVQHTQQVIKIDDFIKFKAYAKTGVIFKELRLLVDDLLNRKIQNPNLNIAGEKVVMLIVSLLLKENSR